jgi:hypothetical protein
MDIYLEGKQRSGNVFLSYAIAMTTGLDVISLRTHRLETLKNYNKPNPFVVPVRDALPSIASAKIFKDWVLESGSFTLREKTQDPGYIIEQYNVYMQYLVDNPKFFIAPFHEFTKDHNKVISKLSKQYSFIQNVRNVTYEEIAEASFKHDSMVFNPETGNLPRPTPKKEEVEKMLLSEYLEKIEGIQLNIDKLYERYYSLPDFN